jgi:hypothetical protein
MDAFISNYLKGKTTSFIRQNGLSTDKLELSFSDTGTLMKGFFWGTTDEFDYCRDGWMASYFVTSLSDIQQKNGEIYFSLYSDLKYFKNPVSFDTYFSRNVTQNQECKDYEYLVRSEKSNYRLSVFMGKLLLENLTFEYITDYPFEIDLEGRVPYNPDTDTSRIFNADPANITFSGGVFRDLYGTELPYTLDLLGDIKKLKIEDPYSGETRYIYSLYEWSPTGMVIADYLGKEKIGEKSEGSENNPIQINDTRGESIINILKASSGKHVYENT